ncbi:tyrosine-type recombinase/integrase [Cellulomonas sp.]|uniref:tyrosine-type recombinase/integrase n=1 Tax=Cellulomonas sp. TaxID=40001 RepID=UPI002D460F0F|nr:tyrosine-type recombinase/integrase [Cellulomonas sp.]HYQ76176.1 tyrosine-type recombinase/integrase [Cellulomonas sp.]
MAHVEDRWMVPGPNGRKVKSPRHGQGSRWLAVWHENDGRRRKRAFKTKDAAEAHLDHVGVELRSGTYIAPERALVSLGDVAERWFQEQVHQRATSLDVIRRRLDNTILPTLGDRRLSALDRTVIQAAVSGWTADGLAPSTIHVAYVYLVGICSLAVDERRIPVTPCRRINLPRVEVVPVVPLTTAKVQELTDALPYEYQRMAVLGAATGMRSGELRGLTWDRVTPVAGGAIIRVDRQMISTRTHEPLWGPPKTPSSVRNISVGEETLKSLGDPGEGLVLRTERGGAMTRPLASSVFRPAADSVGIPRGSGWHELRHYHASLLIARGSSPVAVAHRLGHKDAIETLRTYAHLWADDDERMRDATDGLIRLPDAA